MSQPRPVFHPIAPPAEISDEELADFARSTGVGTMVKSAPQTPPVAAQNARDASNETPRSSPSGPSPQKAPPARKTAPASKPLADRPDLKLSVMVPRYIGKALRQRSVDDECTVRHLVLQGLQAIGIPVKEADLKPDGRLHRKEP